MAYFLKSSDFNQSDPGSSRRETLARHGRLGLIAGGSYGVAHLDSVRLTEAGVCLGKW